jgi:truncated hemoglobin YjbI
MSPAIPYELIGKEDGVKNLASAFYESMDELEEAEEVRQMHAKNLDLIKQKLFEYLNGWLGGPHLSKDQRVCELCRILLLCISHFAGASRNAFDQKQ